MAEHRDTGDARLFTTLLGSFLGAGLAFLSNHVLQRRKQVAEESAATALALFTIKAQLDEFTMYRRVMRRDLHRAARMLPNAPDWILPRPIGFEFSESNAFDFKSLSFLLASRNKETLEIGRLAFSRLQALEKTYEDMRRRHADLHESAKELQQAISKAHQARENDEVLYSEMEGLLGVELVSRTASQLRAVCVRLEFDELRYINTHGLLNRLVGKIFGAKAMLPLLVAKGENLPAWPHSLSTYLNNVRADELSSLEEFSDEKKPASAGSI
jgi:hypothetical protein